MTAAAVSALALGMAGPAHAVDPDRLRDGCIWLSDADEANHVQTCTIHSEALGRDVVVQIRASDNAAGSTEHAVYFLDGLGSNDEYSTWSKDEAGALTSYSSATNLVMPAGGAGEWMTNWQDAPTGSETAPQWDTFIGDELPAYLDENFDVEQTGNAIVGVSMSGAPAVIIGLNHSDTFIVMRSYSGYYETNNPLGWILIPYIQGERADIDNGLSAMWGLPWSSGNQWAANDVLTRIAEAKANGQTVIISTGNGLLTPKELEIAWTVLQEAVRDTPEQLPTLLAAAASGMVLGVTLELGALVSTAILNVGAVALDLPVEFRYSNGGHNWFAWAQGEDEDAAHIEDLLGITSTTQTATTQTAPTQTTAARSLAASVTSDPAEANDPPGSNDDAEPSTSAVETPEVTASPATANSGIPGAENPETSDRSDEGSESGTVTAGTEETGSSETVTPGPTESTDGEISRAPSDAGVTSTATSSVPDAE
ncbi:alpha/beta hydrolase-fold protein [Gordonia sp. NB41Y]|uniref:alpha/beta hydrolase n=1 Tax=Gordonia sp. NB41Y TaxID=875808 RepID=UPI00273B4DB6|nr:alpha/beta hydrolase-fold protein [Gordonia sp. NB41Y]WLP92118.1 alpha/beta hydrolase-fold protein [Gordonia sp. NB41Y]